MKSLNADEVYKCHNCQILLCEEHADAHEHAGDVMRFHATKSKFFKPKVCSLCISISLNDTIRKNNQQGTPLDAIVGRGLSYRGSGRIDYPPLDIGNGMDLVNARAAEQRYISIYGQHPRLIRMTTHQWRRLHLDPRIVEFTQKQLQDLFGIDTPMLFEIPVVFIDEPAMPLNDIIIEHIRFGDSNPSNRIIIDEAHFQPDDTAKVQAALDKLASGEVYYISTPTRTEPRPIANWNPMRLSCLSTPEDQKEGTAP